MNNHAIGDPVYSGNNGFGYITRKETSKYENVEDCQEYSIYSVYFVKYDVEQYWLNEFQLDRMKTELGIFLGELPESAIEKYENGI